MSTSSTKPSRRRRGLLWWLPADAAAFVYTVLLRPKPLRLLAQKLICRIIPPTMEICGVSLSLNQNDAIVSGNLALGCYETVNLELFRGRVQTSMVVVDVGANIGLYSAVASKLVGPDGLVVAVEPDATNCAFIRKTAEANRLDNLTIAQEAIAANSGEGYLYLCETNLADHRTHDRGNTRQRVAIRLETIDELVQRLQLPRVDLMKIDTQGSEAKVFAGMGNTLKQNPAIQIFMEWWPWGIREAGDAPEALLRQIREAGFTVFEIGSDGQLSVVNDDDALLQLRLERQHADVLLTRAA